MTEDRMALLELAEKHADGDFLRELGQWTLQRLMEHHPDRALLLCAVDMPWLTIYALETLLRGRDPAPGRHGPALVGTDGERLHPLPGLYPNDRDRVRALRCFRASGGRSLQGWLSEVGCRAIPLPAGPLANPHWPRPTAVAAAAGRGWDMKNGGAEVQLRHVQQAYQSNCCERLRVAQYATGARS